MNKKSVICIANNHSHADLIVDHLREAEFDYNDISVLFPDKSTTRDFAHERNTKAPEGAATGVSAGGAIGGSLGWLAGIGALAIPGAGPFIAAGPILAALSGAAVGAAVGGIAGSLIGFGIPEYEAKRYEGRVRSGGILISVHADDANEVKLARAIFEQSGAQDIAATDETPVQETKGDIPAYPKRRKPTHSAVPPVH